MTKTDPRPALTLMVGVLATWFTAWQVEQAAGLQVNSIVLATVTAVTLGQSLDRVPVTGRIRHRAATLVIVPVAALGATEVGRLMAAHRWWGGLVFCLVLGAAVWVRRFGPLGTRLGSLATLPFITLLIAPTAPGTGFSLWPAALAAAAVAFVMVVRVAGGMLGLIPRRRPAPLVPARPSTRRVTASTSMAVQLFVGLAASYAVGQWLLPDHWPWLVLSCYVVHSGGRGRGDVLHKGLLRLVGALVGTIGATLIAAPFGAGNRWAVVLLFCFMALAVWLRPVSYAYWAAGVTAMLALLQDFTGAGGTDVLAERLVGVLLGAAFGVAASWFILPVRSRDAFRRRWADVLAALSDLLGVLRERADPTVEQVILKHTVRELERLEPAYVLHLRTLHRWRGRPHEGHPAELVALVREVATGVEEVGTVPSDVLAAWTRQVGVVRKRIRGEAEAPEPPRETGEQTVDRVSAGLDRILDATTPRHTMVI